MSGEPTWRGAAGGVATAARVVLGLGLRLGLGLGLGLVGGVGCSEAPPPPGTPIPPCQEIRWEPPAEPPDLVLVLVDTLRRDRLGLYGGPARTPHHDRFAREGLHFPQATSQAPWTKPSIATLFTGLYPSQHGVLSHPRLRGEAREALQVDALHPDLTTLAETLREAGYETAAFVANPWLGREFGFAQGFDTYDDSFAANHTPGTRVNEAALAWLDARESGPGARPFFLYLHYMDPHAPYPEIPPERLRERASILRSDERPLSRGAARAVARLARAPGGRSATSLGAPPNRALLELAYDLGVEQFDAAFGALGQALEARGLSPGIVLTSDHGEALFDRGWQGHGFGLFDDELGIPLALSLPGLQSRGASRCPVGLVDLMATLCAYLGLSCPDHDQGVPFLGPVEAAPRWLVSEGVKNKPRHRTLRGRRYRLLYEPEGRPRPALTPPEGYGLYALDEDPAQETDLLARGRRPPEALEAYEVLRRELPVAVPDFAGPAPESAPLDPDTAERLKALGYLD